MAFTPTHGKLTVLTVATKDISVSTNTSNLSDTADVHDVTGYGVNSHAKGGGLGDGKFTASGNYDTQATTGTAAVLAGQRGTTHAIVRKIQGTGSGKPQEAFSGVLTKFETSAPCDGYVAWTAEWDITGDIVYSTQP